MGVRTGNSRRVAPKEGEAKGSALAAATKLRRLSVFASFKNLSCEVSAIVAALRWRA